MVANITKITKKQQNKKKNYKNNQNKQDNQKKSYFELKYSTVIKVGENVKEKKDLERALFVNYCKCIKNLTYSKTVRKGSAYPICVSSIYKRRKKTPPKDLKKRCKKYR